MSDYNGLFSEDDFDWSNGKKLLVNNNKVMFKINWVNVKSALVYGLLWGLLSVLIDVQHAGTIFGLDWKSIVDAGVLAFVAVIITLVKNFFTTESGKFLGVVKVVPPAE